MQNLGSGLLFAGVGAPVGIGAAVLLANPLGIAGGAIGGAIGFGAYGLLTGGTRNRSIVTEIVKLACMILTAFGGFYAASFIIGVPLTLGAVALLSLTACGIFIGTCVILVLTIKAIQFIAKAIFEPGISESYS